MKIIFLFFEDLLWNFRCRYHFWLHGPYGLSKVIEQMPFLYNIKYLRKYGATIGENCGIEHGIIMHRPDKKTPFKNLVLGNNVWIGHKCLLDLTETITFEDFSGIGAECQLWTHTSDWGLNRSDYNEKINPIHLGKAAVVYSRCIISQGVTIGDYSRIGAGSVVLENIPNNTFFAGNPATFVKNRELKAP